MPSILCGLSCNINTRGKKVFTCISAFLLVMVNNVTRHGRLTRAVQYWKRLHPFIVPGHAENFALELCDTMSTGGSICTRKLHPSCCSGAALKPDLGPASSPVLSSVSSAFRVASEGPQKCFWELLFQCTLERVFIHVQPGSPLWLWNTCSRNSCSTS